MEAREKGGLNICAQVCAGEEGIGPLAPDAPARVGRALPEEGLLMARDDAAAMGAIEARAPEDEGGVGGRGREHETCAIVGNAGRDGAGERARAPRGQGPGAGHEGSHDREHPGAGCHAEIGNPGGAGAALCRADVEGEA